MPVYNKLVRDKIPPIIEADGKACTTRILSDQEYEKELKIKLNEEVNEFLEANKTEEAQEELADILELIHALAHINGASFKDIERIRREKVSKRGTFNDKIFLIEVEDD